MSYNNQNDKKKIWIPLSLATAFVIAIANSGISSITTGVGPFMLFYTALGTICTCFLYNLYICYKNYRNTGIFWNDQNLIKNGRFQWVNFLGFIGFSFLLFCEQIMVNTTIWTAVLANINAGVVCVIFAFSPLFQAIVDRCCFGDKLKYHHWIGMIMIVICSALLSLHSYILGENNGPSNQLMEEK